MNMARILMLGGLTASLAIPAIAQPQSVPGAAPAGAPAAAGQARTDDVVVPANMLEAGSNSYTEGQARSRMEEHGFTAINNLRRDDNGFWRATATYRSNSHDVAMDFRGRIAHGAGVATIGPRPASSTGATPTGSPAGSTSAGSAARDGTPGNPPGTAVGRAVDRAAGPNVPDGAPGNPPGTAIGRATERAVGPNVPDGTPGNPAGTAAGRALDRNTGTNTTGTTPAPAR